METLKQLLGVSDNESNGSSGDESQHHHLSSDTQKKKNKVVKKQHYCQGQDQRQDDQHQQLQLHKEHQNHHHQQHQHHHQQHEQHRHEEHLKYSQHQQLQQLQHLQLTNHHDNMTGKTKHYDFLQHHELQQLQHLQDDLHQSHYHHEPHKNRHRKNATPSPTPPKIIIKTDDIDGTSGFLVVEKQRRRSNSDSAIECTTLARRSKAQHFLQDLVDKDLECIANNAQLKNQQHQYLHCKKQRKRSNSTTTEKELLRHLNRLSYAV